MVVEPLAQPTQNIAMEIRSRHSETFRGGKAQCSAGDTETRLALRRGSTLNGAGPFSCPKSDWPGEASVFPQFQRILPHKWKYYVNRFRHATLANLSTQGPMNAHERRYVTVAITLIDAMVIMHGGIRKMRRK